MKCEARIWKTYKTRKAQVVWPGVNIPPEKFASLEVCGGDVTVKVRAVEEPYYGGVSASLEVEWTCTRCEFPWVAGRKAIDEAACRDELDITKLVEPTDA